MSNPLKSLNHGLSEELNMLRDTTRQFVENELLPIASEVDSSNDFPHHLWRKMGGGEALKRPVPMLVDALLMSYRTVRL